MKPRLLALGSTLLLMLAAGDRANAQSTDGFHGLQVFPVVVESASFTQRFFLVNPNELDMSVQATFHPGVGAVQAPLGPVACSAISIPALGKTTFTSLRALCPQIAPGNTFGFLTLRETDAETRPFAGYSRVSNPQGNGFSVEAFPAHTFTSADTVVAGIRRLAATPGSPAFQSNCFIGNLNQLNPGGESAVVDYALYRTNEANEFAGGSVTLAPGQLVRLLDVFASAGAAPGDYNDADIRFYENGPGNPGIMAFCTVQDNSSFGADFRIAKQEFGNWGIGSQDGHVVRTEARATRDVFGRRFEIDAGLNNANTHVTHFRHPDFIQCSLRDPQTDAVLPASYGIEMRVRDRSGNVVAGGNNITSFGEVYLGDKNQRDLGANTMYLIEVEGTGANSNLVRPYALKCESGSGHPGFYNIVSYQERADRF